MRDRAATYDMSELEREFELEMDDHEADEEFEGGSYEFEVDDGEVGFDGEGEFDEGAGEFEFEADDEFEGFGDSHADRLAELASREFESESELDGALSRVMGEIEQEFFFGGLAKKLARSKLGRFGISKLKGFVKNKFPSIPGLGALGGLGALTKLARGDLRGALGNLAKSAMPMVAAAVPGGAIALPALKALGLGETSNPDGEHEAWENFVEGAREAYDHLASNLHENVDQPLEASRAATAAYQAGLKRMAAGSRRGAAGFATGTAGFAMGAGRGRRGGEVRTIRLRRGQKIRIIAE